MNPICLVGRDMATVTGLTAERMLEIEAAVYEVRRLVSFSTSSLAADASENVDVEIDESALALSLAANRPSRVRAYSTAAQRTADSAREIGTDAVDGSGLLLEVVFTDTLLQIKPLSPIAVLTNFDTPVTEDIYFAVQNLDVSTGVVTVSVNVMRAE